MFTYLLLLFTIVPALELVLLIKIGAQIGAFNTLLVIIFTGALGAYLARLQGFLILNRIQRNLNRGVMPTAEMLEGLLILCGGIVLLTPGFVTDTIGFLLLIPFFRAFIANILKTKIERMLREGRIVRVTPFQRHTNYYDVDPEE